MNFFYVSGQIVLVKNLLIQEKKKEVDLILDWGFKYDIDDKPSKFFYVEITMKNSPNGAVFSIDEYKKLANEIKRSVGIKEDYFYDLEHPDDGDSEEYFCIWLDFEYYKELAKFFKICREELVEIFLSKIKD